MRILIVGLGVIGTTYGYLFQKAGHLVEHLVREERLKGLPGRLTVELLDGRANPKGERITDTYTVQPARGGAYDWILVSVAAGKLEGALDSLSAKGITGALLLFCGLWQTRAALEETLGDWPYVLGYPVAGGSLRGDELDCVVFDHVMLELEEKADVPDYAALRRLLSDAGLKAEEPFDMLEWIWLHMAVNAGVITTAAKYGDVRDTAAAAQRVMASAAALSEAVRAIRETAKIIASRGVKLRNYNNELLAYKIPSKIAGAVMKRMFRRNERTRRIMTLHSNTADLLFVCKSVYECGKAAGVSAPVFYENYERMLRML